jgi:hypothetical protein
MAAPDPLVEMSDFPLATRAPSTRSLKCQIFLLQRGRRPYMAQSGHAAHAGECPLLGVKQTSTGVTSMSAYDPKRTLNRVLKLTSCILP